MEKRAKMREVGARSPGEYREAAARNRKHSGDHSPAPVLFTGGNIRGKRIGETLTSGSGDTVQ